MKEKFSGNIITQTVDSNKLTTKETIRTLVIADLHGYTNDEERANRLAEAIKRMEPDIIFIAGDLFNGGSPWEGGDKLNSFRKFIQNISEVAPVCITWGNHDLRTLNPKYEDIRLNNFYNLEDVRHGRVLPLYNDKVVIKRMEIIGYVPRIELIELEGIKKQLHGLAHDEFIDDYHIEGKKYDNIPDFINIFLGHDPHLIAASENGIGLGDLSNCDYFVTGHMHNGYRNLLNPINNLKRRITGKDLNCFKFDNGLTERPTGNVDNRGRHIIGSNRILGPTNLCRGIIYIDNEAQQKYLQMPDGTFYINASKELNVQVWNPIIENLARQDILDNNLHYMIISEGIAPSFYPKENLATINVVDITGKKLIKRK